MPHGHDHTCREAPVDPTPGDSLPDLIELALSMATDGEPHDATRIRSDIAQRAEH